MQKRFDLFCLASSWQFILINLILGWGITLSRLAWALPENFKSATPNAPSTLVLNTVQPMAQINAVSVLSDVEPTDWAYQSLQSLAERYSCLVGVPGLTFQGQRALTRWEFAAALQACLSRLEDLLEEEKLILGADIRLLQRLTKD